MNLNNVLNLNNVPDHIPFQEVSPDAPGELGESEAEGEKEGQPEVVCCDRGILGIIQKN